MRNKNKTNKQNHPSKNIPEPENRSQQPERAFLKPRKMDYDRPAPKDPFVTFPKTGSKEKILRASPE